MPYTQLLFNDFLEHIINKVYQNCRVIGWLFPPLPQASSYIKFGGWEPSYNWAGRTNLTYEVIGDLWIFNKTIHFNYKYLWDLMNNNPDERFFFAGFVETIAHEIAHCLLIDYDPAKGREHSLLHKITTELLDKYLWTLPEIQELDALKRGKIPSPVYFK